MKNEKEARRRIISHEGRRAHVYVDSVGHPTIGVGFNLDRAGAPAALAAIGADYTAVRSGTVALTDEQIDALFAQDFGYAMASAAACCPAFNGLDEGPQAVLVDMAFQLGRAGLDNFRRMISALESKDYPTACYEMLNSKAALQTPVRYVDNAMAMLQPLRQVA